MHTGSDTDLVLQAKQGNGAAFAELFSRYWRAARATAYGITGNVESAEDAAAEAFRHAFLGIRSVRDSERFASWLRTIVIRQARLGRRRHEETRGEVIDAQVDHAERPDETRQRLETAALVRQAADALPPALREAVALVYFEGYDTDAAARFLDVPAGTLRRRLHDARLRLRRALEQIQRGKHMSDQRRREIEKLKALFESGDSFAAIRGALALRPVPFELFDALRGQLRTDSGPGVVKMADTVRQLLRPSARASDPTHPVGSIAGAIRRALPEFQQWPGDSAQTVVHVVPGHGSSSDRFDVVLPPGFAEGRRGAYLRTSRAFVRVDDAGRTAGVYETLQKSVDQHDFGGVMADMRLSDVIDLLWNISGTFELRDVQELVERLCSSVVPDVPLHVAPYDEPRYRAALQLHLESALARAASGGVLAEWPGCSPDVGAAHLRIFLEPWAMVRSGQVTEYGRLDDELKKKNGQVIE